MSIRLIVPSAEFRAMARVGGGAAARRGEQQAGADSGETDPAQDGGEHGSGEVAGRDR